MTGVTAPIFIHPSRPHRHGGRPDASLAVAGGAKCPEGRATAGVRRVKSQTGEAASKPRPFSRSKINDPRTKRAPSSSSSPLAVVPFTSTRVRLLGPRFVLCLFCLILTLRNRRDLSQQATGRLVRPERRAEIGDCRLLIAVNLDLRCCHQSTTGER